MTFQSQMICNAYLYMSQDGCMPWTYRGLKHATDTRKNFLVPQTKKSYLICSARFLLSGSAWLSYLQVMGTRNIINYLLFEWDGFNCLGWSSCCNIKVSSNALTGIVTARHHRLRSQSNTGNRFYYNHPFRETVFPLLCSWTQIKDLRGYFRILLEFHTKACWSYQWY